MRDSPTVQFQAYTLFQGNLSQGGVVLIQLLQLHYLEQ